MAFHIQHKVKKIIFWPKTKISRLPHMTKNLLLFALFAIVNIKSYSQTYPDSSYDSSKKSKSIVARYDHSDDAYEYFYVHPGALEQDFERHYFAHLCLET